MDLSAPRIANKAQSGKFVMLRIGDCKETVGKKIWYALRGFLQDPGFFKVLFLVKS